MSEYFHPVYIINKYVVRHDCGDFNVITLKGGITKCIVHCRYKTRKKQLCCKALQQILLIKTEVSHNWLRALWEIYTELSIAGAFNPLTFHVLHSTYSMFSFYVNERFPCFTQHILYVFCLC